MSDNENRLKITIKDVSEYELVEKKSRFIAHACPIDGEDDAMEFIKKTRNKYKDATHNVYAYFIHWGTLARYSDDGEPQGTAGMPVLNVIKMSELTDICIVVTRYFGGTLLGAGGLVRAYSAAAKLAIDSGEIVVYKPYFITKFDISYSEYQKIIKMLPTINALEEKVEFGAFITIYIAVIEENLEKLRNMVQDITNGKVSVSVIGKEKRSIKYTNNLTKKEKK